MKKGVKITFWSIGALVLMLGIAVTWLYQAGQDRSAPPKTKKPPKRNAELATNIDLSPARWDSDKLAALFERNANMGGTDTPARGNNGAIAGTTGAPAVHAGLTALEQGGSAIDALITTSLAQIALAGGAWVSYAGIFELVYYDAASGQVYNLNAGYNTFLEEDDPASIPGPGAGPSGRTAMVPGFFAGVEAAHERFGKLPFASLYEPAIFIADEGMTVTPFQQQLFDMRADVLTRLPETRAIFTAEDGSILREGDRFKQPELTRTLRAVASQGSDYIYRGAWAESFVAAVRAEGGKVTMEDMNRYEVIWQDPLSLDFGDYRLYMHGRPAQGGTHLAESLNLAKASELSEMGDYRQSPEAFFWFSQFTHPFAVSFVPIAFRGALFAGLDTGMENRATEAYAQALWERMAAGDFLFTTAPSEDPKHSDAIVAIDRWGSIAAVTHTINTSAWGETGIFVDGVSVPDSASFQQAALTELEPGSRLPDPTEPLILFKDGKPFGGFSSIGGGLHQKTYAVLYNIMANGASLEEAMDAPSTHLPAFDTEDFTKPPAVQVAEGDFSPELLEAVRSMGLEVIEFPNTLEGRAPRGYVVAATINEDGSYEAVAPRLLNAPAEAY